MAKVIDDLTRMFRHGTLTARLIGLNVGIYLAFAVVKVTLMLFNVPTASWADFLCLPASVPTLLHRPWTLVTYMFMHANLGHLVMNMLWLYWFGRLFLYFFSSRHMRGLYVAGGLGGALLFIAAYNLFPYFSPQVDGSLLVGASAAILAIVVAVAVKEPDYSIQLLFFGRISLKYMALITVLCDILFIGGGNPGGHIAHLGGALTGWWFAAGLRKGYDITAWINAVMDFPSRLLHPHSHKPKMKIKKAKIVKEKKGWNKAEKTTRQTEANTQKTANPSEKTVYSSAEIDTILEKIKQSGYSALTDEEKRKLFDASQR